MAVAHIHSSTVPEPSSPWTSQVKAVSQGLGLKPLGQGIEYTLQVLVDSDGTVIRDSYEIVKYLDEKYPEPSSAR